MHVGAERLQFIELKNMNLIAGLPLAVMFALSENPATLE
jgi:hypothetical protein